MTATDMNHYQTYILLLEEAASCLGAVDSYDLVDTPDSKRIWQELLRLEYNANFALLVFVEENSEAIFMEMKATRDASRK